MKTILTLILIALLTSFHIPEKEVMLIDRPMEIKVVFIQDEAMLVSIVYEYTLTRGDIIPLHIPDHIIASIKIEE